MRSDTFGESPFRCMTFAILQIWHFQHGVSFVLSRELQNLISRWPTVCKNRFWNHPKCWSQTLSYPLQLDGTLRCRPSVGRVAWRQKSKAGEDPGSEDPSATESLPVGREAVVGLCGHEGGGIVEFFCWLFVIGCRDRVVQKLWELRSSQLCSQKCLQSSLCMMCFQRMDPTTWELSNAFP